MRSLLFLGLMAGMPGLAEQVTFVAPASVGSDTSTDNPSATGSATGSAASRVTKSSPASTTFSSSIVTSSTPSSTSTPNVIMVTVAIEALTTTFTPPATCTEGRLSIMSAPGYQIWLNEPLPVPGSKMADCYPSQYIKRYASAVNQSSSIAPLMSPLVCPEGWHTARQYDNAYIACCASGYNLAPPTITADTDRPAYGGTCYSNFQSGQTATVTGYNQVNVTATFPWVASSSADQAYAHPIDGYAMDLLASSSSGKLSGGAIAGIVIGVLAGLALIAVAVFFILRRRRGGGGGRQHPPNTQIGELGGSPIMVHEHKPIPPAKDSPVHSPSGFSYSQMKSNPSASPVQSSSNPDLDDASTINPNSSSVVSPVSRNQSKRIDMYQGIELDDARGRAYAELDAGWKGHEMS